MINKISNKGTIQVCRGGSWFNGADSCGVDDVISVDPVDRGNGLGFRIVKTKEVKNDK